MSDVREADQILKVAAEKVAAMIPENDVLRIETQKSYGRGTVGVEIYVRVRGVMSAATRRRLDSIEFTLGVLVRTVEVSVYEDDKREPAYARRVS